MIFVGKVQPNTLARANGQGLLIYDIYKVVKKNQLGEKTPPKGGVLISVGGRLLKIFNNRDICHATTLTHGLQAVFTALALERMHQRCH